MSNAATTILLLGGGAALGYVLWKRDRGSFINDLCAGALGLSPDTCQQIRDTAERVTKPIGQAAINAIDEPAIALAESPFGSGLSAIAGGIFGSSKNRTVTFDCDTPRPNLDRDSHEYQLWRCRCARQTADLCESSPNDERCVGITGSFMRALAKDCDGKGLI